MCRQSSKASLGRRKWKEPIKDRHTPMPSFRGLVGSCSKEQRESFQSSQRKVTQIQRGAAGEHKRPYWVHNFLCLKTAHGQRATLTSTLLGEHHLPRFFPQPHGIRRLSASLLMHRVSYAVSQLRDREGVFEYGNSNP